MPVGLLHFDSVMSRSGFDVGESLFALMVCDSFDLVEASDCVSDVGGVAERLLALVGEGVDGGGDCVRLRRAVCCLREASRSVP